jgi:hypothetical protein
MALHLPSVLRSLLHRALRISLHLNALLFRSFIPFDMMYDIKTPKHTCKKCGHDKMDRKLAAGGQAPGQYYLRVCMLHSHYMHLAKGVFICSVFPVVTTIAGALRLLRMLGMKAGDPVTSLHSFPGLSLPHVLHPTLQRILHLFLFLYPPLQALCQSGKRLERHVRAPARLVRLTRPASINDAKLAVLT